MALITLPALKAAQVTMRLIRADHAMASMAGNEFIVKTNVANWAISIVVPPQRIDVARPLQSALARLSDLSNTFQLTPPDWVNGVSYGGANPLVFGTGQLGSTLFVDGLPNNAPIMKDGDYFTVNGEFKMTTSDTTSTGTGTAAINFTPALRQPPADNAVVDVKTPKVTLRLIEPVATWVSKLPSFYTINIDAIETYG